ncbi:recombinase family protein [Deinococcus cellulosilyticus]|uniref:Resolvase n=1 Tax=Deinococcus cellulosilyticus (strain DSM 18568 / NBRC 106333 / KACC 11606 / 5516J-15) TaxID=1223518 RepID=A0A511NAT7_DEIC1|nr:recombinase family protein [Deinococcus cellulosilyticus]GEM49618.1 resolvase [Deinococcus cellulosilyticus NBRC 106333 = KACC 11606]
MKAIAYYRISRKKESGIYLGMEAQRSSVESYARVHQLQVIQDFEEVETGTGKRHRPQLQAALKKAQQEGAVLLIAKLDRLARNVRFIAELLESKVRFVAVDMPEVDNLTIHILAAVAEKEAKLISTRTRDALATARAKGTRLGKPENLTHEAQLKGAAARRDEASMRKKKIAGYVRFLRDSGMTFKQIQQRLTEEGNTRADGKPYSVMFIHRAYRFALEHTGP